MKFLFMSKAGALHGAAARVAETEDVLLHSFLPSLADVPISRDWRPDAKQSDLVVVEEGVAERDGAAAALRLITRFVLGGWMGDAIAVPPSSSFLAFWNGQEWMSPFFRRAALNRMLSGDLGTVEVNTAVALRPVWNASAPWQKACEIVQPALSEAGYRGPVAFAQGWAYPGIHAAELAAVGELLSRPLGLTLYDIAAARSSSLFVWSEHALALQISSPPYPHARLKDTSRPEIQIVTGAAKHFWAADMSPKFEKVGWSGLLGYATARGRGQSLREASRRLDRVLSGIGGRELALQYRTDATAALTRALGAEHE